MPDIVSFHDPYKRTWTEYNRRTGKRIVRDDLNNVIYNDTASGSCGCLVDALFCCMVCNGICVLASVLWN